jgi:hypothetical protein
LPVETGNRDLYLLRVLLADHAAMSHSSVANAIESDREFFALSGPMPTVANEKRRFPRFYFRSCAEALIYPLRGGDNPQPAHCYLLTRDISRSGIGLVHTQQLFPGQRVDVILNGQSPKQAKVVWCRRFHDNRYVVGCKFCNGPA